jgi:hypothetical protein
VDWGRATPLPEAGSRRELQAVVRRGTEAPSLSGKTAGADEALKLADHRGQSFSSSRLQVHAVFSPIHFNFRVHLSAPESII